MKKEYGGGSIGRLKVSTTKVDLEKSPILSTLEQAYDTLVWIAEISTK